MDAILPLWQSGTERRRTTGRERRQRSALPDAMEALAAIFPAASAAALAAVLQLHGGDVSLASEFLLSNDLAEIEGSLGLLPLPPTGGLPAGGGAPAEEDDDEDEVDDDEDDGEDGDDDEDKDAGHEQEWAPMPLPQKRARRVEPTPPEQLRGQTTLLVQFDLDEMLSKV